MNSYIKISVVALSLAFVIPSCKKGEDDPFLSLKSRNARLTGEWELKDASGTYEDDGEKGTFKYENEQLITTPDNGEADTIGFKETIEFMKKDKFQREITYTYSNDEFEKAIIKGGYNFLKKNKSDDTKNKEVVGLIIKEETYTDSDGYNSTATYEDDFFVEEMKLRRLTNKEMIVEVTLTEKGNFYPSGQTIPYSYTETILYTFEKK